VHVCQIFPSAFGIVKADDDAQRLEHLDTLQAQLEDLEQHMATTNKPFLGGLNLKLSLQYWGQILTRS